MRLENLSIATHVMRSGMTLRDFFEECVRCNVPGLPYLTSTDRVVGRISIRDVFKYMAIPDNLVNIAHVLGDETDRLDLTELQVIETLALPVENFLLKNIPSVSPRSSIVKALAIMEQFNTSYIFLIENGEYRGLVTRMVITRRMLTCVKEYETAKESGNPGDRRLDSCFPRDE